MEFRLIMLELGLLTLLIVALVAAIYLLRKRNPELPRRAAEDE